MGGEGGERLEQRIFLFGELLLHLQQITERLELSKKINCGSTFIIMLLLLWAKGEVMSEK